jgi:hypothetical protein
MDAQVIEIIGRNWLINQLVQAGLEVALPVRDRGVDLIAYADRDSRLAAFKACPIQMKAASVASFGISRRYERFPNLLLAYVWYIADPKQTVAYALTHEETVDLADGLGWTQTRSWIEKNSYSTTAPNAELTARLQPYKMTPATWWAKVTRSIEQ